MRESLLELLRCPWSGSSFRLTSLERDGDDIAAGVLTSEAGEFPVLDGVPVFQPAGRSLDLLRAGNVDEAVAEAALHDRPAGRLRVATSALTGLPAAGRLLRRVDARVADRERRAGARYIRARNGKLWDGLHYALADRRPAMPDALRYFTFRYSMPRHLVGLSVLQVADVADRPVLDVGCGLGHLTWSVHRRWPEARVVGVDGSFVQLWAARRLLGGDVDLVCGDATMLPFRSHAFGAVTAFDVFSFITGKWAAAREVRRVLGEPGFLAITSVTNALRPHVFAGEPLSPAGWSALLEGERFRVLADDVLLERYLHGRGVPSGDDPEAVAASRVITLLAGRGDVPLSGPEYLREWPHAAGGDVAVNPLYRAEERRDGGVRYVRSFPDGSYATDNPEMVRYLPESFDLDSTDLEAARCGELPPAVEMALERAAVLALPPGYVEERWPGPEPTSGVATAWKTFQPDSR